MSKTSRQEQRRRDERQLRQKRQVEMVIRTHKTPKMIPDEDGKEYRTGDPEYKDLELEFLRVKAVIKAEQIYGRKPTDMEIYDLYIGMGSQMMPAEAGAALEKLRDELGLEGGADLRGAELLDYLFQRMAGAVVEAEEEAGILDLTCHVCEGQIFGVKLEGAEQAGWSLSASGWICESYDCYQACEHRRLGLAG